MDKPALLLARLYQIGDSLARTGNALALIGLGSVGRELERLDEYSDLDFFVIVEPGYKEHFIQDLSWLASIAPIAYHFRNTPDGYKLLFADGVFCEFAVFEQPELSGIPFAPGRIVWKRAGVPDTIGQPIRVASTPQEKSMEWLLGEALTNLYVGLHRELRGERLSAMRLIQYFAVDRIVDLSGYIEKGQAIDRDDFARDRRYEQNYPGIAHKLPQLMGGYEKNRESAREILQFLVDHFEVNPAMESAILDLCIHVEP